MKTEKKKKDFETIFGREIEVAYKPREAFDEAEIAGLNGLHELFGKTEKIKLKEISRADIPKYYELSTTQNELQLANLIARKPLDSQWSNLLTTESFDRVLDTGQEIDLPLLSAWFRRTMKRNEALMPGSADIATKAIAIVVDRMMKGKEAAAAPSPELIAEDAVKLRISLDESARLSQSESELLNRAFDANRAEYFSLMLNSLVSAVAAACGDKDAIPAARNLLNAMLRGDNG